jgi:hypothetical protein
MFGVIKPRRKKLVCINGETRNRNIIYGIKLGRKNYTFKVYLREVKCLTATEYGKTKDTCENHTELTSSLKPRNFLIS